MIYGKAGIRIEWNEDGYMNVYHSDGTKLSSKKIETGKEWDRLWAFLRNDLKMEDLFK